MSIITETAVTEPKIGIVLINLGTPKDPTKASIRKFLREFLSDPRVIDIPGLIRFFLVNFLIIPFRTKKVTRAYRSIWTEAGSPLRTYSNECVDKVKDILGDNYKITVAMRYGEPSIKSAVKQLMHAKVEHIKFVPLFPQYASATNGSVIAACSAIMTKLEAITSFEFTPAFYQNSAFINSWAQVIKSYLKPEMHLLLSFHGLPERQLHRLEQTLCCDMIKECPEISDRNKNCYRAQCYATARLIAKHMNLPSDRFSVSFQSRLGRIPWIKPYTDEYLVELREKGIKHLAIVCPSFVSDCLETLEEIKLETQEEWLELGGETFVAIPCLNADDTWCATLAELVR